MCKHVLCDAHDKRITKIKIREPYAMSVKTEQFGLAKPPKPEHPIYKTRTSSFFRHIILTKKYTPIILRHSHLHIKALIRHH
jgi:hypothetical protein